MVIRVETAKDHLTVIELNDAVTMVAVGNRSAFTVERRENKVFVTPTDEGAKTNLFIWTIAAAMPTSWCPAADIDQMHFAIDQKSPEADLFARNAGGRDDIGSEGRRRGRSLPAEMLTAQRPVLVTANGKRSGRVEVSVRDLYRKNHRLYLPVCRDQSDRRTSYLTILPTVSRLWKASAPSSL